VKKVAYGLVGLLVLLVALILIGPSFVDWNAQRERIAQEARRMTGRELIIDGDISLAILPAPALSVQQVRLANVAGGSKPTMAELSELRIRIALLPLLKGQVQVESLQLVEPRILLEVLADGRRNWDFGMGAPDAAQAGGAPGRAQGDGGLAGQVRIDSFAVTGGTLVYRDETSGLEERIDKLDAEVAAESLAGPVTVRGSAALRGIGTRFELAVGKLLSSGATPLTLTIELPGSRARAKVVGSLSRHSAALRYRGHVSAEGDDLGAVLRALNSGGLRLPAVLRQGFALESEVAGDLLRLSAKELRLQLGGSTLTGAGSLALGDQPEAELALAATRVDLDQLLAQAKPAAARQQQEDVAAEPAAAQGLVAGSGFLFGLPPALTARLEIAIEGLIYRQQALRQLRLAASLKNGLLMLDQAEARMPGGSELTMGGQIGRVGEGLSLDGRVRLTSDNLRGMASWLGVDLSAVPPDRLRRLSFEGAIGGDGKQISLKDIDLKVDITRVNGGIVAALRQRPGLGIGLAVDQLNLDAYLPAGTPLAGVLVPGPAAGGSAPAAGEGAADAGEGALAFLKAFDANLDLKLGKLTAAGVAAKALRLTATLQNGSATLRGVSVEDLAGGRGKFVGVLSDLGDSPVLEGVFDLAVADPLRFAREMKLDADWLARLGPFDAAGTLRCAGGVVTFDSELSALEGAFGAAGSLEPYALPLTFDVAVTARHPDLAALAGQWNAALAAGQDLGELDLKGRLAGNPLAFSVTELSGALGPLALSGGFIADLSTPEPALRDLDLSLELKHPDLSALAEGLAVPLQTARPLGAVDLRARLTGALDRPRLSELDGRIGDVELSGEAAGDLTGAKPAVTAKLAFGVLPVAALIAPLAGRSADPEEATATGAARWSRRPIDLAGFHAFDAELDLTAQALALDRLRLEEAALRADLRDGRLRIERLTGKLAGGGLELSGEVAAADGLDADLELAAKGVDIGALLAVGADFERIAGPLDLTIDLATRGASEAALIGGLSGRGKLEGRITLEVTSADLEAAHGLDLPGGGVAKVAGIGEAAEMLRAAFAESPAELAASFTIENGAVATEDLRFEGTGGYAVTQGSLRLPQWRVKSRSNVFRAGDGGQAYLSLDLEGPLDEPDMRLAGLAFQPKEEPQPEAPTPEALPETAPEATPEATPEPAGGPAGEEEAEVEAPPIAEAAPELEPVPEPEAEAPAEPEARTEAEVAAAPEPEPAPQTSDPAPEPEPAPQAADPAPEPEPEPAEDPEVAALPEAEAEAPAEPAPEVAPEAPPQASPAPAPDTLARLAEPETETTETEAPAVEAAPAPEAQSDAIDEIAAELDPPPLPKRKPALIAELAASVAEEEPADSGLEGLLDKVLTGLKAPQPGAISRESQPELQPEPPPEAAPEATSEEAGTQGFVGKILEKLKK
jgi:uncharacterized protein involved in outer membrane biogenesis